MPLKSCAVTLPKIIGNVLVSKEFGSEEFTTQVALMVPLLAVRPLQLPTWPPTGAPPAPLLSAVTNWARTTASLLNTGAHTPAAAGTLFRTSRSRVGAVPVWNAPGLASWNMNGMVVVAPEVPPLARGESPVLSPGDEPLVVVFAAPSTKIKVCAA